MTVAVNEEVASVVIAHRTPNRPRPRVTMPARSKWRRLALAALVQHLCRKNSAAEPIGTLIQKIHRHET